MGPVLGLICARVLVAPASSAGSEAGFAGVHAHHRPRVPAQLRMPHEAAPAPLYAHRLAVPAPLPSPHEAAPAPSHAHQLPMPAP